jgi:hypothetical protein
VIGYGKMNGTAHFIYFRKVRGLLIIIILPRQGKKIDQSPAQQYLFDDIKLTNKQGEQLKLQRLPMLHCNCSFKFAMHHLFKSSA